MLQEGQEMWKSFHQLLIWQPYELVWDSENLLTEKVPSLDITFNFIIWKIYKKGKATDFNVFLLEYI